MYDMEAKLEQKETVEKIKCTLCNFEAVLENTYEEKAYRKTVQLKIFKTL